MRPVLVGLTARRGDAAGGGADPAVGLVAFPVFLVAVLWRGDRDERRFVAVTLGGIADYFVSLAVWIAYAEWRGI